MRTIKQTITAGGTWTFAIPGRYFRILDSSTPVDVNFYQKGSIVAQAEAVDIGYYSIPVNGFDRIDVISAAAQTVKVAVSDGNGGYDSTLLKSSVVMASTIVDNAPVTVGVAAVALTTADSTRKGLRVYNAGTADIYIGGSGVTTANGTIKIPAGALWTESEAAPAAWYGISGTAGQSVRVQEVK